MATSERSPSPAPNEIDTYSCKHCSKKVVTKVQCTKCLEFLHPACLRQSREQKNSDCKHATNPLPSDVQTIEKTYVEEENRLLRLMIEDKNMIIADKEKLIQMLHEKIALLEAKQTKPVHINNTVSEKSTQSGAHTKSSQLKKKKSPEKPTDSSETADRTDRNPEIQDDSRFLEKQVSAKIMEIQTKQKLDEVINLAKNNRNEASYSRDNDDVDPEKSFTTITRHKKRRVHKVGSGQADENLQGKVGGRKIWLFISKVPDKIKVDNLKKYIEQHANTTDVHVKKLDIENPRSDNQAFMVGLDPKLLDRVYEPNFWPRNICFSRFNFKKGQRFLDNPQSQDENFQKAASTAGTPQNIQ